MSRSKTIINKGHATLTAVRAFLSTGEKIEVRFRVDDGTVRVVAIEKGGNLQLWQNLVELCFSFALLTATWFAAWHFDPAFGALWMILSIIIAAAPIRFMSRLKLFSRSPEVRSERFEKVTGLCRVVINCRGEDITLASFDDVEQALATTDALGKHFEARVMCACGQKIVTRCVACERYNTAPEEKTMTPQELVEARRL